MTNVIQFTPRLRDTELQIPQADSTRGDISTKVSNITDAHIPEFYLDRHTRPEYPAQEFFDVLTKYFRKKQKPIITIIEEYDAADCIVEISSKDGTKYQLPGSYFYSLIVRYPAENIENYGGFLCNILDQYDMVAHVYEESLELSEEMFDDFIAKTHAPATGHICEVHIDDRADVIASIGVDNFVNRDKLTLLDLMVGALYEMLVKGKSIYEANMVIEYGDGDTPERVSLPAYILLTIVYRSIAGLHPLYRNLKNDRLLQWYLDTHIAPWISLNNDSLER